MEGKKQVRSNNKQLAKLADIMSTDAMFANGEYTGPLGSRKMEAKWKDVRELLKELGPDKTVEQWKQTWRDLKRKARKQNATANTARHATGNTLDVPVVSNTHLKVLDAIGHDCSVGIGPEETEIGREIIVETYEPLLEETPTREPVVEEVMPDFGHETATRARRRQRPRRPQRQEVAPSAFLKLQQDQNCLLKRLSGFVEGNSHTTNMFKIRAQRRQNTFGRKWW